MAIAMLGFNCLMLMLPLIELLYLWMHVYVPILPVLSLLLGVSVIFSGQLGRFWEAPISKPWIVFLGFMSVAALLGAYPRESAVFVLEYGIRYHVLPFYCCAFLLTTRQVRNCMYWITATSILLIIICLGFGEIQDGRFAVLSGSTFSNPNDLAFWLLLGATAVMLFFYTRSAVLRAVAAISLLLTFYFILRTGSRANFLTLVVLVPVTFFLVPKKAKMAMLILGPVFAIALATGLSSYTLERLTMIVSDPTAELADNPEFAGAIASQMARTQLQERAAALAMHHPILGVGARQFEIAVESMVRNETGQKSGWQEAHNTYLQIAAENGIPAFLCFLAVMILCLKMNIFSCRECRNKQALQAALGQSVCLLLMTVAYAIGIAFNNSAYDVHFVVVVGFSTANYLAVKRESAALGAQPAAQSGSAMPVAGSVSASVLPSPQLVLNKQLARG